MSDPQKEEDDRTVVVSNVSSALTQAHLRDLFTAVGKIAALSFSAEQGRAFVEFERPEAAQAAVFLSGTQLGDKAIQVILKANLPPPPTEEELAAAAAAEEAAKKAAEAAAAAAAATAANGAPSINPLLASASLPSLISPSSAAGGAFLASSAPLLGGAANPLLASIPAPIVPATPFQALMANNPALAALAQAHGGLPAGGAAAADPSLTSRTIYVGNLGLEVTDAHLRAFFAPIGLVVATKFSDNNGSGARYAFVEFAEQQSANAAHLWNGRALGDRCIRVGKAQNSITKQSTPVAMAAALPGAGLLSAAPAAAAAPVAPAAALANADPDRVAAAMDKVRRAQEAIARKLQGGGVDPAAAAAPSLLGVPPPVAPVVPFGVPPPVALPGVPAAAALPVNPAANLLAALGYAAPAPAAAAPAVAALPAAASAAPEESKHDPSERSRRRRSRSRSDSRSPSRSRSRSPRSRSRSHKRQERPGSPSNQRWGGGAPPRSRSRTPPRSRSRSPRRDYHRRSRSPRGDRYGGGGGGGRRYRSRSPPPHWRSDYRRGPPGGGYGHHGHGGHGQGYGGPPRRKVASAPPGREGMVFDGFQWQPAGP